MTDRTNGQPSQLNDERAVEELRRMFAEGRHDPRDEFGEPCTLTEYKRILGEAVTPPISAASVHKIVTGKTYPHVPGPTFPTTYAVNQGKVAGRSLHYVEVYERVRKGRTEELRLIARIPAGSGTHVTYRTIDVDDDSRVVAARKPNFGGARVVDPAPIVKGEVPVVSTAGTEVFAYDDLPVFAYGNDRDVHLGGE